MGHARRSWAPLWTSASRSTRRSSPSSRFPPPHLRENRSDTGEDQSTRDALPSAPTRATWRRCVHPSTPHTCSTETAAKAYRRDTGMCSVLDRPLHRSARHAPPRAVLLRTGRWQTPCRWHWALRSLPRSPGVVRLRRRRRSMLPSDSHREDITRPAGQVVVFNNSTLGMVRAGDAGQRPFPISDRCPGLFELRGRIAVGGFHAGARRGTHRAWRTLSRRRSRRPPVEVITDPNALASAGHHGRPGRRFRDRDEARSFSTRGIAETFSMATSNMRNNPRLWVIHIRGRGRGWVTT